MFLTKYFAELLPVLGVELPSPLLRLTSHTSRDGVLAPFRHYFDHRSTLAHKVFLTSSWYLPPVAPTPGPQRR